MTTRDTEFELILRGRPDQLMLALIAEYDLSDSAAEMILHKVVVDRGTLDGLLVRARALGVDIARLRVLEPRPPTVAVGEPVERQPPRVGEPPGLPAHRGGEAAARLAHGVGEPAGQRAHG